MSLRANSGRGSGSRQPLQYCSVVGSDCNSRHRPQAPTATRKERSAHYSLLLARRLLGKHQVHVVTGSLKSQHIRMGDRRDLAGRPSSIEGVVSAVSRAALGPVAGIAGMLQWIIEISKIARTLVDRKIAAIARKILHTGARKMEEVVRHVRRHIVYVGAHQQYSS